MPERVLGLDEIAEVAAGAAEVGGERRDEASADTGGDDRGVRRDRCCGEHLGDSRSDLRHLTIGDRVGGRAPVLQRRIQPVAAEAAGETLQAFFQRGATAVGGDVLIHILRQLARDAAYIRHGGEASGGEAMRMTVQGRLVGDGRDVRAREAGVDELAGGQALAVGEPARDGAAADDGNDVGGGRPHVDQKGVAEVARNDRGGGEKVGRGDGDGIDVRFLRAAETARAHPDGDVGAQDELQAVDQGEHAGLAVGEDLAQLAGHGGGMVLGARAQRTRRSKGRIEPVEALPQRARDLLHRKNARTLGKRHLEVGSPHIIASRDAHLRSLRADSVAPAAIAVHAGP